MARLTWDNVASPNFSGIADSYRVMSQLLSNATQSGTEMVDTIRNANAQAADRAILQRMVGVTDPTQFNPNAVIGADGSRASLATLRGVGEYADTLVNRAMKTDQRGYNAQDQAFTQYGRDRTISGNQILDQNSDAINTARSLAAAGQMNTALATLQKIPGLRPDQYAGVLGDVDQLATRDLARDVTSQRLTEDRYGFGRNIRNDNAGDQANAALIEVLRTSATPTDARAALERMSGQMSPEAFSKAMQGLGNYGYGNVYAPLGSGGAGASGGVAGETAQRPSSGAAWAQSVGLLGSESGGNYGASNNAVGSGGKRGHFGALQFGQDRLADAKRAGVIPQNMTPEQFRTSGKDVQDKVADWHFADIDQQAKNMGLDRFYGQNIGGVVIDRDSIRGMAHLGGIGGVQKFITSGGKINPADANGTRLSDYGQRFGAPSPTGPEANFAAHMVDRTLQERLGQNNATGISANYANLASDSRDANQVATALADKGGAFAGTNRGFLLDQINHIVNKSGGRINPAMAGAMMSANTEQADGLLSKLWRGPAAFGGNEITPNLAGGIRINDDNLRATMDDYLSGKTSQRTLANESMGAMSQVSQAAQAKYQSALQQYQAALIDAQSRPGAAANLPRFRAAVEEAAAVMNAVQTKVAQNPNWRPNFDTTKPNEEDWMDMLMGLIKTRRTPTDSDIDRIIRPARQ